MYLFLFVVGDMFTKALNFVFIGLTISCATQKPKYSTSDWPKINFSILCFRSFFVF